MASEIDELLHENLNASLEENRNVLDRILEQSVDILKRSFLYHSEKGIQGLVLYTDGLVRSPDILELLKALLVYSDLHGESPLLLQPDSIRGQLLLNAGVQPVMKCSEAVTGILSGDTLLLIDGMEGGLLVTTRGWEQRSVEEPATESIIRGPRDGFTENIRVNTALIRRRIRDPHLRIDSMLIGSKTLTEVNIAYIKGIVKEGLVDEVKARLSRIRIDGILESGYIEEYIEDAPLSPFTTVQSTERPDRVAAALLEGRAAILVDNTPFALIVPTYFWQYMQASDDYFSRYWVGSFFRLVRYVAFLISMLLPSLYVMLVSFHQEMIPTGLAFTIASGRDVVPFPVLLEALFMELSFELMREAGLRMPKPIGQAVSIVGSLIIGQAAVQAGLVSPFMVIIVAITGIASFALPNYAASFAIRLIRFPLLIASGFAGLLGFAAVFFTVIIHAISLRSFGEPYLSPATPFRPSDQKDIVLRPPWWSMIKRPQFAQGPLDRQPEGQRPKAPVPEEKRKEGEPNGEGKG